MFDYWRERRRYSKERRRLEGRLDEIYNRYVSSVRKASYHTDTIPEWESEVEFLANRYDLEVEQIEESIEELDTNYFTKLATKWGIDVRRFEDWWTLADQVDEYTHYEEHKPPVAPRPRQLTQRGRAEISQKVSEAQFEYCKKWVDLLSPVISTVIALIALVISIIALHRS